MRVKDLQELLDIFVEEMADNKNRVAMTKTAVLLHTVKAFGVESASQIPSRALDTAPEVLADHLKAVGSSRAVIRSNKSFVKRLIEWGKDKDLVPTRASGELSETWLLTIERCRCCFGNQGGLGWRFLGSWASAKGLEPSDLTSNDLLEFAPWLEAQGRYTNSRMVYHYLERTWNRASRQGKVPALEFPPLPHKRPAYRLPLRDWPPQMQADYEEYKVWATADFVPGRRRRNKQRLVTAVGTLEALQRIAGYFVNIRGIPKDKLDFLTFFDRDLITSYLSWLRSSRGVCDNALLRYVIILISIGLRYLELDREELAWLGELKEQLQGAKPRDKSWKMISLEELCSVPERLRQERVVLEREADQQGKDLNQKRWAAMVRNEVMIRLFIARVLRSRNIREARLGRNIRQTSDGTWRIAFEGEETKAANRIASPFPEYVVPCLMEYLKKARPILAEDGTSDLLFPSVSGKALTANDVRRIVGQPCQRYFGKPVHPHLIRDIVATGMLAANPEDYLKVSKLLGHESLDTTLRIYSHYTADHAAKSYDEFLQSKFGPGMPDAKEDSQARTETAQESADAGCEARQLEKKAVDRAPSTRRANRQNMDNKDNGRLNGAKKPRTHQPVLPLAQDVHSAPNPCVVDSKEPEHERVAQQADQKRQGSDPARDPGNKSIQTKGQGKGRERKASRRAQGEVRDQLSLPGFGLRDEDEENG